MFRYNQIYVTAMMKTVAAAIVPKTVTAVTAAATVAAAAPHRFSFLSSQPNGR